MGWPQGKYGPTTRRPVEEFTHLDRHGNLAMANHRAEALFGVGPRDVGRPFQDLELSYRPLELRSHIRQALTDHRSHTDTYNVPVVK